MMSLEDLESELHTIAHDIGDSEGWDVELSEGELLDTLWDHLRKDRVTVDRKLVPKVKAKARQIADNWNRRLRGRRWASVADRVAARAYVQQKLGKYLAKVWFVRDPLPSDLDYRDLDPRKLVFELSTERLIEVIAKMGLRRWKIERGALHTDASSALKDAESRTERFNKRFQLRLAEEDKEGLFKRRVKQRGAPARKRKQRYRQTKQKSRMQAKKWRQRNPAKYKKQQKRYRRNPAKYRMKRRADSPEVTELDIPIWNLQTDQPGEIDQLNLDEGTATVTYDGEPTQLDVLDLLDDAVLVDEQDESELWESLDAEFGGDDELATSVLARWRQPR